MANKASTPPSTFLQDLFESPPQIAQSDMWELVKLRDQLTLAKADHDAVAAQIAEMLILGCPIQPGHLTVRIGSRGLEIFEGEVKL